MVKHKEKIGPITFFVLILLLVLYCSVIEPALLNRNIEAFHSLYEEELQVVLGEYNLELRKIEYTDLVPDHDLDYWATERINEYEVKVYLSGEAASYSKIYEILREVSYNTNDYLLSNTFEILDDGAYVDDDSKETGFHQVVSIFVFEDGSAYRLRYSTTLDKDGEIVWKWKKPTSDTVNVPAGECNYPECDHNRAEGKYYCHQHKCCEDGCLNSTTRLVDYCDQHNCTYGSCSAPRYKAVDSTYCQRHYIESLQD